MKSKCLPNCADIIFLPALLFIFPNKLISLLYYTLIVKAHSYIPNKWKSHLDVYGKRKIALLSCALSVALINALVIWGIAFGVLKHKGAFSNVSSTKLSGLCFLVAIAAASLISSIAALEIIRNEKLDLGQCDVSEDSSLPKKSSPILSNVLDPMSYVILPVTPFLAAKALIEYIQDCCCKSNLQNATADSIDSNYSDRQRL